MTNPNPSIVIAPLKKSLIKESCSFFIPPVPIEFYQQIGFVTVFWAYIEPGIDNVLLACLKETGQRHYRWQGLNFRKRKKLLRQTLQHIFPQNDQRLTCLLGLLDEAANLQWKRNLLVHGRYEAIFPKSGPARLEVIGKVNGMPTTLKLTVGDLQQMYHELAKMAGKLNGFFDPSDPYSPLPSHDRCTLRELLRRHLNGSIRPIPQLSPQS